MQLALDHQEAGDLRVAITGLVNYDRLYVNFLIAMRPLTTDAHTIEKIDEHLGLPGAIPLVQKIHLAKNLGIFFPTPRPCTDPWAAAARLYMGIVKLDGHAKSSAGG